MILQSRSSMQFIRPFSRQFSTFTSITKSQELPRYSTSIDAIKELHGHLIRTQKHKDPDSISLVFRSYSLSSTTLHKAQIVFDQIQRPPLLIWNHLIKGLSKSDDPIKAIYMYNDLRKYGLTGNNLTFIFVLKACGRVSDVLQGKKIHVHGLKLGFESYLFLSNALIHMYGSCGEMGFAQKVFDEMTERDLVTWNSLICGYSQCNKYTEVLGVFDSMQVASVRADAVTMVKVIMACNVLCEWNIADSMIDYIVRSGVDIDVYLGNTLIDMYGKRRMMDSAQGVFEQMSERNGVSWNSLMIGYAKIGNLVMARKLFHEMPKRDVISWTSMITGYSQAGKFSDAVKLYQEMMSNKIKPDEITISSVLSACAHLGMYAMGKEIHKFIIEHNIRVDIYVGNSLIDLYSKCGDVTKALQVFHGMSEKDPVSWTAVIAGLAVNGFADSAVQLFEEMLGKNVRPTNGTFVGILLACSHAGLVDKGVKIFESMYRIYGIVPQMKHNGCVVDLLSRSGELERAYNFILKMTTPPDVVLWRILLSACKLHKNVALAEIVSSKLLESDAGNSGNYVLLSDAYAGAKRWDAAMKYRDLMEENRVQKPSAWSSVEVTR
ncbi:pentatricopeptide repeat-containing protein At2g29760, chloroplastic-like [Chenopodium quinoa]|uniref:pentatricopeptide repeat-containing protein At2g29760, chloroplastic-like n=1 Tax=Chenopodium quinoa TaxID=63459 RepID=UPI000B7712C2|nr:pentatricopeptide repeat-containing protein At2g29760, chloroplastic-like [Chenopodium quinoa]